MATLLSYALTNVPDVKETMGIASADLSWDNLITRTINQATEMIEGWCNRRFKEQTGLVEYYDATFSEQLILRQYPVTSTTTFSLEARNTTLNNADFSTVPTDQYFVDTNAGIIDAVTSFWGKYDQWRVTYSAGYATIPSDLAEACAQLAAYYAGTDPSQVVGIVLKREGSREVRYSPNGYKDASDLFVQLGIMPTLQRYSTQALGSLR